MFTLYVEFKTFLWFSYNLQSVYLAGGKKKKKGGGSFQTVSALYRVSAGIEILFSKVTASQLPHI